MPTYKNPREAARALAPWFAAQAQLEKQNDTGNGIDVGEIEIKGRPHTETLRYAPLLTKEADRKAAILNNAPATFDIKRNPSANSTAPVYEDKNAGLAAVEKYNDLVQAQAKRTGLDPDFIKATMFMETSHGSYGSLGDLRELLGYAKTYRPMNVNPTTWGSLAESGGQIVSDPAQNIRAGSELLARIKARLPNARADQIATLYNSLFKDQVTDYGARVARIASEKPWTREKSLSAETTAQRWLPRM